MDSLLESQISEKQSIQSASFCKFISSQRISYTTTILEVQPGILRGEENLAIKGTIYVPESGRFTI